MYKLQLWDFTQCYTIMHHFTLRLYFISRDVKLLLLQIIRNFYYKKTLSTVLFDKNHIITYYLVAYIKRLFYKNKLAIHSQANLNSSFKTHFEYEVSLFSPANLIFLNCISNTFFSFFFYNSININNLAHCSSQLFHLKFILTVTSINTESINDLL